MKLKKKHRPMKFHEWMKSTGGAVLSHDIVEDMGEERVREIAEGTDPEAMVMFERASDRYHDYLCAHIAVMLEKKR